MKTNIALIGFMGTGKTAVGQLLAKKLKRKFFELDSLIEQKAGKSIPEIFEQDGEIAFRELEIEVTKKTAKEKNSVIACGGGIVLNKINIDRLKRTCVIVCLTASPAVILKRTSGDKDGRPLLAVTERAQQIKELMKVRRPFYERSAEITVNTSGINADSVAGRIIEILRENESYRQ